MSMSTIKKRIVTVAVAAGLVASNAALFTSSAMARDHGWRQGQHRPYVNHAPSRHYAPYHHGHRRDRTGDAVGAAILGIGALIVGAAIADGARKKQYRYEDRFDD